MIDTGVVILNYNAWRETLKEVDAIKSLFGSTRLDVIVVDNASTDGSFGELEKVSEGAFTLIQSGENKGYAAGNNVGLRYCSERGCRYAWILNNDIEIDDPDTLSKLIAVLTADESVAVVNPDIYAPDGHMFNRDSQKPSFFDLTFGMLAYRKKGRKLVDLGGYGYVYRPQGCCMLVDLQKMSEVDYMDEHTFLYSEEIILAERLWKKSYRCACCTETKVVHNHSATVKSNVSKRRLKKIKLSSFDYYLKEYRGYRRFSRWICRLFYSLKLKLLNG